MSNPIPARIEALRHWMRHNNIEAYIFPSTDPHAGEYVPDHWKAREWITGFNGSAGTAVVSLTAAALWTDSRYWLAAEEQVAGTPFTVVHCLRNVATPEELTNWIVNNVSPQAAVALDAWTSPADSVAAIASACTHRQLRLLTHLTPYDDLWTDRAPLPTAPMEVQPLEYAGIDVATKLSRLRSHMAEAAATALLVTCLDEIAWLLNVRGRDVHCTPVVNAYLVVTLTDATLYVDQRKVTPEVAAHLEANNVHIADYSTDRPSLHTLPQGTHILADPTVTNAGIMAALQQMDGVVVVPSPSPIPALRAIKNEAERKGMRDAHVRDGVAMVRFLRWLDQTIGKERITEMDVDARLTALRREQPLYRDISFDTIAGYGPHAAIVHYEATPATDAALQPRGLLLLDSGAQYQDGTTDITRTIALGALTDQERRDYTLVLRGHLRLALARFPEGTTGTQLDVLARYAMWQCGLNYGHGTGHGVGAYLSVHEGPQQFRMNYVPAPLQEGMTITIEPGIYIAGSHGVRTENTMLIVADGSNDFGKWLRLEPLTLCPIDMRPIVVSMMEADEVAYLNAYHRRVRTTLLPLLNSEDDRQWLLQATEPLALTEQ